MTVGLLLAAGAGSRMGTPKALLVDPDGTPRLHRSVAALREGGCTEVYVVLGARSEATRAVLGDLGVAVVAEDWEQGMSASLRAGLDALAATGADAALVSLVDLPDVGARVVERLLAAGSGPGALARATYDGRPGHPVLLGRDHWASVRGTSAGDAGARDYLATAAVTLVACEDLASGRDVDRPEDLGLDGLDQHN